MFAWFFFWLMLQGADAASRVPLPGGSRQVFVMPENLSAVQKEDVAWASYVLLRNTNTTSVVRFFRFSYKLKFNLIELAIICQTLAPFLCVYRGRAR